MFVNNTEQNRNLTLVVTLGAAVTHNHGQNKIKCTSLFFEAIGYNVTCLNLCVHGTVPCGTSEIPIILTPAMKTHFTSGWIKKKHQLPNNNNKTHERKIPVSIPLLPPPGLCRVRINHQPLQDAT